MEVLSTSSEGERDTLLPAEDVKIMQMAAASHRQHHCSAENFSLNHYTTRYTLTTSTSKQWKESNQLHQAWQ